MTKEDRARKELSDFLNKESERPYDYSNWDIDQKRRLGPYEQRKSFSDRYRALPTPDETQEIAITKPRNYSWVFALAFLTAFSISYCSNTPNSQKEEPKKYEVEHSVSSPSCDPPAFRQGPKK